MYQRSQSNRDERSERWKWRNDGAFFISGMRVNTYLQVANQIRPPSLAFSCSTRFLLSRKVYESICEHSFFLSVFSTIMRW